MIILGINAYHGDASAALLRDGQLVAAAEEERFNRIKHSAGFPYKAVEFCLKEASATLDDVGYIAVSRNPSANLYKKVTYMLMKGNFMSKMVKQRLANVAKMRDIKKELASYFEVDVNEIKASIVKVEHHLAHAASAFYVSPFSEATIVTVDGFGDFCSTTWGTGRGNEIELQGKIVFPHSLGIFYTALCQFIGFRKYGDEGKVMGLAPYGQPEYMDIMSKIVIAKDHMFELGLHYFLHHTEGVDMTWESGSPSISQIFSPEIQKILGEPREPHEPILPHHENIAASMQSALEETAFSLIDHAVKKNGLKNLVLAGGVAFNSVMNGKIKENTPVEHLFIQPAAGDAGTALGAALHVYHTFADKPVRNVMTHAYTGPSFSDERIEQAMKSFNLSYEYKQDYTSYAAQLLAESKIIGWFNGKMEYGPRALGNRSILADPRRAEIKDILNARIKHRESFRPFAPAILYEFTGDYFESSEESPFMLLVYPVKFDKRTIIPAVTHVDGTGRLQTVKKEDNSAYYKVIQDFYKLTGVPVILNTSFNENEPIVCTPEEAIQCFLTTRMDALFLTHFCIEQKKK
ncbi:MAG: carbamoyltransferase [Candidatus Fischerbacteria bacterium RBG_13_37_8]|uniref:Carbamoyltransferase n=1 Tax=Candidatus Fischerbacteria bacterium RBG_13_37_8 TaxID=1817863 RepID=A0A1F5V5K4_9BACT|nr:MAG: carbamoyltransferase [Candidatus Fischerbacteria bacterium RBG_13_37_8]